MQSLKDIYLDSFPLTFVLECAGNSFAQIVVNFYEMLMKIHKLETEYSILIYKIRQLINNSD